MLEAIETNPKISIIVPTLDNFIYLQELISSIHAQTLPPSEIIIADSSSSNAIEISPEEPTTIELSMFSNNVEISKEKHEDLINFFETLEEDDDVQNIFSNAKFIK